MKVLERPLGSIPFAAGQTRTLELPRNYAYRRLYFKLGVSDVFRGAHSVPGDSGSKDSAPAHLINNIAIRANGRDVIKSLDFAALHRMSQMRHGTRPFLQVPDVWTDDDAAILVGAAINMEIAAFLDFEMWRAIRPADTFFNSRRLTTLELIVDWANPNAMMLDNYDDDVTLDEAVLHVDSLEAVGMPADVSLMVNKENKWRLPVATSGNQHVRIPVGNVFRQFVIRTTDGNGALVNDMIGSIVLRSGTEVYKLCAADRLQMANRLELGLETPIGNDDQDRAQYENVLPGYYLLDFVKDGRLTEALDTRNMSDLELELNVTAAGTSDGQIEIYPTELIMPPTADAA